MVVWPIAVLFFNWIAGNKLQSLGLTDTIEI